jgi:hypothetical protein
MAANVKGFTNLQGKGSQIDLLPHRHALTQLAGGDPLAHTEQLRQGNSIRGKCAQCAFRRWNELARK